MRQATQPITIKRYGGCRFYDAAAGRYVTLQSIADLIRTQRVVVVRDAKTGEDVTSDVLTSLASDGR